MGDKYRNRIKFVQRKLAKLNAQTTIPASVAINSTLGEWGKDGTYKLIFRYYNHRQCELNKIREFKPLIDKFNEITKSDYKTLDVRSKVFNNGDYKNLFTGIPPDQEYQEEIKFSETGRIIFFRVQIFLCVTAVLNTHRRVH